MITIDTVWSAYRGLHRYFLPIGSAGKVPVPTLNAVGNSPQNRNLAAAGAMAIDIQECWNNQPAMVSEEYYAYLYLFAQSLRVSYRENPTFVGNGKWKGLCWFPLFLLRGRPSVAKAMWLGFYHQYIAYERPRPDQAALSKFFPWVPPYTEDADQSLPLQWTTFQRLRDEDQEETNKIFREYNCFGRRHTTKPRWHPIIVLSQPESWVDGGVAWDKYYQTALDRFLDDPKVWQAWGQTLSSFPPERWKLAFGQLERYFKGRHRAQRDLWRKHRKHLREYGRTEVSIS